MRRPDVLLDRRGFLRLGMAAIGAEAAAPYYIDAEQGGSLQTSAPPVVLRSKMLHVTFDTSRGIPLEYRMIRIGLRFEGEVQSKIPLMATVCCRDPWNFERVAVVSSSQHISDAQADFRFEAKYKGNMPAAAFSVRYVLDERTVFVTLEDVKEYAGFELISLSMPALVTVSEDERNAWLAHGDSGGDFVALKEAKAGHLATNSFWGEINGVLPVIMAGHSGAVCVQETTAFMDGTLQSVVGETPDRRASLGTTKVHRVDGNACYDMNLGKGVPKSCGNKMTPNLLVEQKSACRLDFLEPAVKTKPLTWLDGAKLVRARMPAIPNHFYDDKFIYGICTDEPKFSNPSTTFERCEEIVREVHALTDGAPQLVHLWGWQFRGKDTGYPAVSVVDERIGGYEGMMRLKDKMGPLNTTLSLSDNYDDAYRSSPAWDETTIARKPDGDLWKSREWTGEESYIQGLAKYMEGPGVERVRYTCERYKLPATIHVDVLSYFAIRNDWDPKHPASGIRNLFAGRYKVLEEFGKHGVDVTSEGLRYPYLGKISMCWYAGGPNPCPFGGKPIPMLSLIYRQSVVWGRAGNRGDLPLQLMMFYGEAQHSIVMGDTPITNMLDSFYLAMVPWFRINHLDVEDFERIGDRTVTKLAGTDNRIEVDWSTKGYRMVLDGAVVAREGATFCPLGKDKLALYTIADETLTAMLPMGWKSSDVRAFALYGERKEAAEFTVHEREITVKMQARRPVMTYRT